MSSFKQERMSNWRPISEFASTRRIGMPSTVTQWKNRVMSNAVYFMTNYIMVGLAFCVLTLLLAPRLAFLISLPILLWVYLFIWKRDAEWVLPVLGRPVGDREKLIAVGVLGGLVFLYAASDLIWIVGATCVVVVSHGVFYKSREEHEQDTMFEDVL